MKMKCMLVTAAAIVLGTLNSINAQNTFPSTGNVGVGTTTPANKLTVKGDGVSISQESADGTTKVGFYTSGGFAYVQTHSNHPLYFTTNNMGPKMALLVNGNVGIGTQTPAERLTVQSATNTLGLTNTDGTVKLASYLQTGSLNPNLDGAIWGTTSNHPLHFRTNNANPQMTILPSGYVGIGTFSPTAPLEVSGKAKIGIVEISSPGNFANNTAVGYKSLSQILSSNINATFNVAVGYQALELDSDGTQNCATGYYSLRENTTGSYNTSAGAYSLNANTIGDRNSAFGNSAMAFNKTGVNNTGIGYSALRDNVTGNNNAAIGFNANVNAAGYSNATIIGSNAIGTASNQVRIGNSSVTSIGGYANWTNVSDARVKRNIKANVPGLQFINKLTPVTYNLDLSAADKIIGVNKEMNMDAASREAKERQLQTGFLAQDVEKAAMALGYEFSGVDVPKNDKDLYGLRYAEFVVPLVKSVQELSKMNEEKDAQIKNLQQQIDELTEMIKGNKTTVASSQNIKLTSALLEQNVPNPFNDNTTIAYSLPEKYSRAKMVISDKSGNTVKEIVLSGKGKGTVNINSSSLNSGTYQYSLYADGVLVETKQMILVH